MENNDDKDIMVVTNPEGLVVLAGQPRRLSAQEQRDYLLPGWKVETMAFKKYKELNLKWVFDK